MKPLLLKGVRPYGEGEPIDLLIRDGVIAEGTDPDAEVIEGNGAVLLPGFVDLHTHLREPGREDTETIETGSRAAALGGYTAVFAMANTDPVADNAVIVEHVLTRAAAAVRSVAVPEDVPGLLDQLARTAVEMLDRDLPAAAVLSLVGTVVGTSRDTALLHGWLRDGGPRGRLAPTHRWDALVRLAELGEQVEDAVEAELRRDSSSAGRLAALSAGAAVPEATVKRAALDRLLAEDTSNRELGALSRGLWSAEQRDLVDPLVTAYLERAPEVGHGAALVDAQALDLVEDRQVRRVVLVGAEDLAGADDVDRRGALQQGAHLHR